MAPFVSMVPTIFRDDATPNVPGASVEETSTKAIRVIDGDTSGRSAMTAGDTSSKASAVDGGGDTPDLSTPVVEDTSSKASAVDGGGDTPDLSTPVVGDTSSKASAVDGGGDAPDLSTPVVGDTSSKASAVDGGGDAPDLSTPVVEDTSSTAPVVVHEEEESSEEKNSNDSSSEQSEINVENSSAASALAVTPLPAETGVIVLEPKAGSYNSNAWAANTMFRMNLNDRLGSYFQGEGHPHQGSAWIRYSGSHSALKDESGQLRTKGDKNTVMMGIDMLVDSTNDRDQVTLGVMGGYGHYDGKTSSSLAGFGSKGKVDGYGLGLYGTYQQNAETQQGVYVDSWLLWNQFDNHVKGNDLPGEKYKSKGMTASLELGYNAKIAEHNNVKYVLQPHAQLIYQHVRSDNFTDGNGTRIEFLNGSRMQTSVGLRAAAHVPTGLTSIITPHIEANWLHTTKGYGVRMNNADAKMNSGRDAGQLKLGVEGNLNQRLSLNVEVFHNQGTAGYHETGGNLMAKYRY
ncbi:autotransporter outer membrane beta-barrel domain-containing protein [Bordetella muralis]|uniref:autotransporter outer membrane beta-barrel domain-containing protein n=1 Tax=Bordetella muralis TaxID=1649130 RepID=UPI0039F13AB9